MKITKIIKEKNPFTGVSKTTGRPYTIYESWCEVEDNGATAQASVKSYQADAIQAGKEYPAMAEEKSYEKDGETKSYKQYFVKPVFSGGTGKSGRTIVKGTWSDFKKIAEACQLLAGEMAGQDNNELKWQYWSALFKSAWTVDPATIDVKDVMPF